uniref:Ig-like domain-containing protein n=1 Tax=Oreochromis aureus TaxID=47969 RepID=A0AAZ1Y513_OREAU
TLQHSWSQIFTGETITLRCEIQGGEGKVWKYEWTAPNTNSPPTSSEYRISRVSVSHSGDYRCRGSSDYLLTGWSDAFRLTVSSSKPRATLTAQSSVIPAGGSVTLSCSVEGSAGWKFDWFRRDSVSSKAQLMRGNEANRVISVSQGGLYHCRGGRGDPVFYTEDSSDVTVQKTVTVSGADSSSSPVWLIVGLVCGVSLIIILLLLLYRCTTTNSPANEQTLNKDEDQQQVYSSLFDGDRCVYETVRRCENTEN